MARKTNYSFEKRQKELKRLKKKEEKLHKRQGKPGSGDEAALPEATESTGETQPPAEEEPQTAG